MIYGIEYNTDRRNGSVDMHRFTTRALALAWREKQGPGGIGQPFGPDNGHRYVREVYELEGRLPTGSRLIGLMDRGRCSSAVARANYVMDKGRLVG